LASPNFLGRPAGRPFFVWAGRLPSAAQIYYFLYQPNQIAEGYAALAEAEADRPGIISPSDALNAAREAAKLARSLPLRLW
jgi:hypothetical protein